MGRGRRDLGLEPQWRERMEQWRASGLSVRAFCLRRGLAVPRFYYWKRELRSRDAAAMTAASRSSASKSPTSLSTEAAQTSRPTFVPVTVRPDTVIPAAMLAVEVRCPSGHVVVLSACAAVDLADLFAALAPLAPLAREAQPC